MKTAIELANKGHAVTLCEKSDKSGGRLEFADHMEFKEDALGETVAVVGGGQVGCELAVHLKSHVKRIQLVEAGDELMPDAYDTPEERYWTIFC